MSEKKVFGQIGIVGLGTMGGGIACVVAKAGFDVRVVEQSQDLLKRGVGIVSEGFRRLGKGAISDTEVETLMKRIGASTELSSLAACDLVIEAVFENLDVKKKLFKDLDSICRPEAVFASNTSSLSITEMASVTGRKERLLGLHFFNPVLTMPLVEVVRAIATEPQLVDRAVGFIQAIGKVPIVAKDNAGFIVNLLLTPFLLDAMQMVSNGFASVNDVDTGIKLGLNHPMGPLMLSDFIGLDIILSASKALSEEYGDQKYASPPILRRLVSSGYLGLKAGRGFYSWADRKNPKPINFDR